MNKRKLKEIINKSKEISAIGDPFDLFVSSLSSKPENYRLREAWEYYDKPKDYNKAIEVGLIKEVNNTPKFASIGYNENTDEYEYLNKGRENEIVAKDIQVWDNDVIPFVKELKQGGFIRTYNEEKDCWTYSKNKPQETQNEQREINSFQTGGQFGDYELFVSVLPDNLRNPDPNYNMRRYWELNGKPKTWFEALNRKMFIKESDGYYHAGTVAYNKDTDEYEFMKQPNHPTIQKEIDWYNSPEGFEFAKKYKLVKPKDGSAWKYVKKEVEAFKQGGQMNVIPEGALHARKNNMDLAAEGEITHKGIPVVDNEGNQQAEVEKEELTITKEVTDKLENWYKKFYDEETSKSDKDEIAIKCGKYIAKEILFNTDDRVQLIEKIKQEL